MRIGRFVLDPRVMSDERDRVDGCARPPLAVLLTPTRSLSFFSFLNHQFSGASNQI